MRIAYVTADRGIPVFGAKGASVHIQEMVNAFAGMDHEVSVFATRRGPQTVRLDANVIKVRAETAMQHEISKGEAWVHAREEYSLAVSAAVGDAIAATHVETPFALIYERYALFSTAGVRAARRLGIPCLVEVNSPLLLEQQQFRKLIHVAAAEAVEQEVFSQADVLICVSDQVAEYVVSKGAPEKRVQVIPNAVDPARFNPQVSPEKIERIKDGRIVIGFSGSLKPWHGIGVLLDAFRLLAQERNDVHLLVVGDGPLRDWLEGYVQGASLENRVTLTGWVANDKLPAWVAAMDIATAPYPELENFYFSPLKLLEYMACGLPVVASNIGQIAKLLRHESTGLLVDPGDPEQLAAALNRLADSPSLCNRLGRQAACVATEHTWQKNAQRVIELSVPASGLTGTG